MSQISTPRLRESYRTFRELLEKVAPLPWRVEEGRIVDASGMSILGTMVMGDEERETILGAVLCGVSTCGGYQVFGGPRMDAITVVDLLLEESADTSKPVATSDDDIAEYMSHSDADPGL